MNVTPGSMPRRPAPRPARRPGGRAARQPQRAAGLYYTPVQDHPWKGEWEIVAKEGWASRMHPTRVDLQTLPIHVGKEAFLADMETILGEYRQIIADRQAVSVKAHLDADGNGTVSVKVRGATTAFRFEAGLLWFRYLGVGNTHFDTDNDNNESFVIGELYGGLDGDAWRAMSAATQGAGGEFKAMLRDRVRFTPKAFGEYRQRVIDDILKTMAEKQALVDAVHQGFDGWLADRRCSKCQSWKGHTQCPNRACPESAGRWADQNELRVPADVPIAAFDHPTARWITRKAISRKIVMGLGKAGETYQIAPEIITMVCGADGRPVPAVVETDQRQRRQTAVVTLEIGMVVVTVLKKGSATVLRQVTAVDGDTATLKVVVEWTSAAGWFGMPEKAWWRCIDAAYQAVEDTRWPRSPGAKLYL